jgi:hypothetical protein
MSKLTVDTIEPSTGTTVTLGASGDTFTIPSGVTLTNNGAASGFGKVLQVVQTEKTDTTSHNSTTFTDVSGMSATITPSSSSNKILVMVSASIGNTTNDPYVLMKLLRGSTEIFVGDQAGSNRPRTTMGTGLASNTSSTRATTLYSFTYLDSPSTTSATTYKLQWAVNFASNSAVVYLNRTGQDVDDTKHSRSASSIILMEIAG